MITMILLLIATVVTGIVLLVGGASVLLVFGDFIVFALIVKAIIKALSRK